MSTCDRTIELLPWYLNGTLDESDTDEVRQHLRNCHSCAAELRATAEAAALVDSHPAPESLIASVLGEPDSRLSHEQLENHVFACATCREELRLLGQSLASVERASPLAAPADTGEEQRVTSVTGWRTAPTQKWLALAASLLAVAGLAGWWTAWYGLQQQRQRATELAAQLGVEQQVTIPRLNREVAAAREHAVGLEHSLGELASPLVNPPILDLLPRGALRGGPEAAATVPRGTRVAILILDTGGLRPASSVSLTVVDPRGGTAIALPSLLVEAQGGLTVGLPLSKLGAGRYELRLQQAGRVVARYDLDIE